jgi:tetratricopeptide (TPR) repeat protein
MFHILPLLLIILSLGVIAVLVARRYPELTLLDLDTIPDRKEKKVKKELLTRKASKRSKEQHEKIVRGLAPVVARWGVVQSSFRGYVKRLKDEVKTPGLRRSSVVQEHTTQSQEIFSAQPHVEDSAGDVLENKKEGATEDTLKRGIRALQEERFQEAESAFIRAIERDQKDVRAYEGLADVYVAQKQYEEARETYLFARKLDPQNVTFLTKLAFLAEEMGDWAMAIGYYEDAVVLEDTNASFFAKLAELYLKVGDMTSSQEAMVQAVELLPRHLPYLDMLVEISIMVQDKEKAEEGMHAIRMIDASYARLDSFRDRVAEMGVA